MADVVPTGNIQNKARILWQALMLEAVFAPHVEKFSVAKA